MNTACQIKVFLVTSEGVFRFVLRFGGDFLLSVLVIRFQGYFVHRWLLCYLDTVSVVFYANDDSMPCTVSFVVSNAAMSLVCNSTFGALNLFEASSCVNFSWLDVSDGNCSSMLPCFTFTVFWTSHFTSLLFKWCLVDNLDSGIRFIVLVALSVPVVLVA